MLKQYSFYIILLGVFTLYSCAVKRVVSKDDVQVVKTTPPPASDNDKVEEIIFKDITPESKPPIKAPETGSNTGTGSTSGNQGKTNTKPIIDKALDQEFNIAMVIPLADQSNTRFLQYYGGAKIASKELEKEGSRLNITVIDANDQDYLSKISSTTDLIIAPSEEKQIKALAEYGKSKQTPVLSSFFSLSSMTENPYYIQTRPSLKSHYNAMVGDIHNEFSSKDVVIVGRKGKNESSWFEPFQAAERALIGTSEGKPFSELLIDETMITFSSELATGKKVFVFPNFSFKDEDFLQAALTKLMSEKGSKKITVYAMSVVKDGDKIGKQLYEELNIKIPTSKYVDNTKDEIKTFTNDYFMSYSDLPTADALEGADNMLFIGRALSRYGRSFPDHFYKLNEGYLHTAFDMRGVSKQDIQTTPDYYENQHIVILSFDGMKFRP